MDGLLKTSGRLLCTVINAGSAERGEFMGHGQL